MKWDSAINLAFAAENLFAAAQLLTSDLLPWNRALRIACEKHLVPLLENDEFLPSDIRERLLEAHRSYVRASSQGLSPTFARQLGSELMAILREISEVLNCSRASDSILPNLRAA